MILPINNRTRLVSDERSWAIQVFKGMRLHKSTGNQVEVWEAVAFYPSLEGAVQGLLDRELRASDAEGIQECLEAAKQVTAEIVEALSPEVEVKLK